MQTFDVHWLMTALREMLDICDTCEFRNWQESDVEAQAEADDELIERARQVAKDIADTYRRVEGFKQTGEIAGRAAFALSADGGAHSNRAYQAIQAQMKHVIEAIIADAEDVEFIKLSRKGREIHDHQPELLGVDVFEKFPSARNDVVWAGDCLAAGCNTAAVFHLMRSVEWGLRALCVHFGMTKARVGKQKYVPISYSDWEHLLNQLHPKMEAKIEKMRRGVQKQKAQEFYYPIWQDIKASRDAFRNHVMHGRAEYTQAEALAIFDRAKRLMSLLATRVSEKAAK